MQTKTEEEKRGERPKQNSILEQVYLVLKILCIK